MIQDYDLSIIIPHYQNAGDLQRLLASIPDNGRFETIVIDDYSDDDSFGQVLALKDKFRFELIKNTGKKSAGTCRNRGLAQARGKWILFADSDDFFLEPLEAEVYRHLDSDCDIVFFPPTSVYDDTFELANRHLPHVSKLDAYLAAPSEMTEYALRLSWHCPWSKLYKLSFLKRHRISFDEVVAANDSIFSLVSGIKAVRICVSTNSIYCAVSRKGSLQHSYNRKILESRIRVAVRHRKICEALGYSDLGSKPLEFLYLARYLSFCDCLYLVRLSKKLGVFNDFRFLRFAQRSFMYFCSDKFESRKRKERLIVVK